MSVSLRDRLATEAASQALESFRPLPLPHLGLPLCWCFWPVEGFDRLEDLWSVLWVLSWTGLFPFGRGHVTLACPVTFAMKRQ